MSIYKSIHLKFLFLFYIVYSFNLYSQIAGGTIWEKSLKSNFPYTITQYGANQGLIQNQINDIHITKNNKMIISSLNGLMTFNGFEFKDLNIKETYKKHLFVNIFTYNKNLFSVDGANKLYQLLPYFKQIHIFNESILSIVINEHQFYALTENGSIYSIDLNDFKPLLIYKLKSVKPIKINNNNSSFIYQFPYLYIVSNKGLLRVNLKTKTEELISEKIFDRLKLNPFNKKIYGLILNKIFINDSVIFKIDDPKISFNDIAFKDKSTFFIATSNGLYSNTINQSVFFDNLKEFSDLYIQSCCYDTVSHILYLGTNDRGLLKLVPKNSNTISKHDGFSESSICSIIKTPEGKIICAQNKNNLYEINNNKAILYHKGKINISCIASINNYICVGTWGKGVQVLENKKQILNIVYPFISSNNVHAIFQDSKGIIWIGTDKGISSGKNLKTIKRVFNYEIKGQITCFYELKNGNICVGGYDGFYIIEKNKIKKINYQSTDDLFYRVRSFYEDDEGKIWIGSYGGGLFCYSNYTLKSINNMKNCMLPKDIFTLVKDNYGYLNMTSNYGLWRVSEKKLKEFYNQKLDYLIPFHYSQEDGILNMEFNGGFQNNCFKTDSFIYFPTIYGIVRLYSEKIKPINLVPKIEAVYVNDSLINNVNHSFDNKNNSIKFIFSTINQRSLYNSYFQYKLIKSGIDVNWSIPFKSHEVNFKNLSTGKYIFKIRVLNGLNDLNPMEEIYEFDILPFFYESIWFQLSVVIIIILISLFILNRSKNIKIKQEVRKREISQVELEQIQTRMNPHFVFNAMSSIKYFLKVKNYLSAQNYLDHFSKLLRQYIDYSDNDFIDVETEINLLISYLEIEKTRFPDRFSYLIDYPKDLNNFLIPTYILQPLVENSIKHGILPSENTHYLQINFKKEDNYVLISIEDDGIGRVAAKLINTPSHKSKGLELIKRKLTLLKIRYTISISIDIIDKEKGTLVILKIPL